MKGKSGERIAIIAPSINKAPVDILSLVKRSLRICTVNTLPEIRLPSKSSSRIVTVDSPVLEGNKLCHIILVEFRIFGNLSVILEDIMPSKEIELCGSTFRRYSQSFGRKSGV